MQSKSSVSVSGAIIKENLKKYWSIPLITFVIYLVNGLFSYYFAGNNTKDQMYALASFFRFDDFTMVNVFLMFILFLVPIVLGVAVFKYSHNIAAVSIIHSFPFSRATNFLSNYISGLILLLTPIILTAISLLPVTPFGFGPSRSNLYLYDYGTITVNWGDLLYWLLSTLLVAFFIYSLTVFAGMITGTTVMHVIVAIFLNIAAPVIYNAIVENLGLFLFGFSIDSFNDLGTKLHPYSAIMHSFEIGKNLPFASWVLYLGIALLVSFAALVLYRKLKFERAGNSFTYSIAEYIVVILVSLLVMAAIGSYLILFSYMSDQSALKAGYYSTCIIAGIIAFIIANMLAKKSFRVFEMGLLKRFCCFAALAVVFLVTTTIDITGFQKNVPSMDKEDLTVKVNKDFPMLFPYKFSYGFFIERDIVITESVDKVVALHEEIVNNIEDFRFSYNFDDTEDYLQESYSSTWVEDYPAALDLNYAAKGGFKLKRSYSELNPDALLESDAFLDFIHSDEFVSQTTIESLIGYDNLIELNASYAGMASYGGNAKLKGNELIEFAKCLDEDYLSLSKTDRVTGDEFLGFEINFKLPKNMSAQEKAMYSMDYGDQYLGYSINEKFTKSIAWLKDHDLLDKMIEERELVKKEMGE